MVARRYRAHGTRPWLTRSLNQAWPLYKSGCNSGYRYSVGLVFATLDLQVGASAKPKQPVENPGSHRTYLALVFERGDFEPLRSIRRFGFGSFWESLQLHSGEEACNRKRGALQRTAVSQGPLSKVPMKVLCLLLWFKSMKKIIEPNTTPSLK